ncbi:MAG: valine--tRNA ligase [Rickettsiales bacterium]|jgi:valyl-tRNA synthetase|nr:valine--tRNA ligase [Rickettsiales bacterium]
MAKLEKKYNPIESEKKWQKYWEEKEIFRFNWNDTKKENIYSIDTPPPTVSGTLHMGHICSFTHTDLIARFQRMYGKNVYYPIGFDDNGLPTERYVEKQKGIKGKEIPRNEFIKICQETIKEAEDVDFYNLFHLISHSYDWSLKYQTISKDSAHIAQLSFIDLYNKGVLYRKDEPCIIDVADQTALAQTEIEDKEFESQKNYIKFDISDKNNESEEIDSNFIEIMTTRPELLPACVALLCHPSLYSNYKNKVATTPLGVKVPIISDDKVNLEKGTGFVMCCTFGDQTDIEWWKKYNLDLRICLNERGRIELNNVKNLISPVYLQLEGMNILDARREILNILRENGKITRNPEKIFHFVKIGERSKEPIEFLITKQWNVKVLDIKNELHKKADEVIWHPNWMKIRMHEWIDGLSWDWTISRQRFSGIPLPVWYSKRSGEEGKIIVADVKQLPVDPLVDLPNGYERNEVIGDGDVLDTWFTSSLSPQLNSRGITKELFTDSKKREILSLPFSLRPQSHEIIRTWAFCTIVKAYYHENKAPWENIAISGWCLSTDGTKMSKSKGNIIDPLNIIAIKGSDSVRYWAGKQNYGTDSVYSDNQINSGQKLITKLFNSAKFCEMCFEKIDDKENIKIIDAKNNKNIIETVDKWLISQINKTIIKATNSFKNYEFCKALEITENFFWNDFCNNYLEIVKVRCYGASGFKYEGLQLSPNQIENINKKQQSALQTIYYVFNAVLKLFAPFLPSVCDEIYSCLYENEFLEKKSISARNNWADNKKFNIEGNYDKIGSIVIDTITEVRKYKTEKNTSIKESLSCITIYANVTLDDGIIEDLKNVCNTDNITIKSSDKFSVEIQAE